MSRVSSNVCFVFVIIITKLNYFGCVSPEIDPACENIWPSICRTQFASPINILPFNERIRSNLSIELVNFNVPVVGFRVKNTGLTAQVLPLNLNYPRYMIVNDPDKVTSVSSGRYVLNDVIHFHWARDPFNGTEHALQGKRYAAEMHFMWYKEKYGNRDAAIHSGDIDSTADLSVLFKESARRNLALNSFAKVASKIREENETAATLLGVIRLNLLLPRIKNFVYYSGTLVRPPCIRNPWFVFDSINEISKDQLTFRNWFYVSQGVRKPIETNIRPLQPLYNRKLYNSREQSPVLLG